MDSVVVLSGKPFLVGSEAVFFWVTPAAFSHERGSALWR